MPSSQAEAVGGAELRDHLASHVAGLAAALPYLAEVESAHDVRVGARRLRSLLLTFTGYLPASLDDDARARLHDDLRWLGRVVGELRDVDVLVEQLALIEADPTLRDRWLSEAHDQRVAALGRVELVVGGSRVVRLIIELEELVTDEAWLGSPAPCVADVLPAQRVRVLSRVERARRARARTRARARLEPKATEPARPGLAEVTAWHDVRKAAKQLRYAAEALTASEPSAIRWANAGRRIQTVLGKQLDREGVASWLDAFATRHEGDPLLSPTSRAQADTERRAASRRSHHARRKALAKIRELA